MKRRESIQVRIARTASCFASLAVFAPGGAAASDSTDCRLPAWTPVWISSWSGDGCR